jgi:hypothetical protein
VFEALALAPATLPELAARLGVAAGRHRLRALLDVLAAIGALTCERSIATAAGSPGPASLPPGQPLGAASGSASGPSGAPRFALAAAIPPRPVVPAAGWGLLAEVIRRDRPLPIEAGDAERRMHHHLASAGAEAADELVRHLGTTSLLDLGAGAGAYSKAFLAAHPAGRAMLVDTASVLELAAGWLGPLAARARLIEGDATEVDAGTGHGAALLANVVHLHSPAMCARLVQAAARGVAPGGAVVIKDLRVDEDRRGPLEGLLFALNMALYTEGGDVYPISQLRAWLVDAGLVDVVEHRLAAAPDAIVVIACRPATARERGDRAAEHADHAKRTADHVDRTAEHADRTAEHADRTAEHADRAAEHADRAAEHADRADHAAGCEGHMAGREPPDAADADVGAITAELEAALARTAEDGWRSLAAAGELRAEASGQPPVLALPGALRRFLAQAIAHERRDADERGDTAAGERAAQLVRHYTDVMPRMRIAQLAGTSEPGATLFHTPLDWDRLPRLTAALDRLFAVVAGAGLDPRVVLGAASAAAFRRATATLAALYERTHYGGLMPLLYGFPADLAYVHAHGVAERLDPIATIDRYLTAPIVHELCHLDRGRRAVFPPHLDECIAGWLGVHVHPALAYPADGHDDALYAAPWLAQVGQAVARTFGIAATLRAHAGDPGALPAGFVDAITRFGWADWCARRTPHFLSDTFDPRPWIAIALAHASASAPCDGQARAPDDDPGFDRAIVEDGLRAMCLTSEQVAGSFRTRTRLPDGPIRLDADGTAAPDAAVALVDASTTTSIAAASAAIIAPRRGPLDPVTPRYWLPPTVAARLHAHGLAAATLHLHAIAAIPAAAAAICDAAPADTPGFSLAARDAQPA